MGRLQRVKLDEGEVDIEAVRRSYLPTVVASCLSFLFSLLFSLLRRSRRA
jgi:hypothetical protein